jgi:uncharacterized protein YaeQ
MREITTLDLRELLGRLKAEEEAVLAAIDADPLLKKRERADGLVIANASAELFEPRVEHQLYAKGIVFAREPYRLVSLPLVKMYNHGSRPYNEATTATVEVEEGVRLVFPEKVDGTMIQLFAWEGKCLFTTRSILEGSGRDDEELAPYVEVARGIAASQHPELLDPEVVGGLTLIFEMIHPMSRQVTFYGEREELVLLSVFEREAGRYWTMEAVQELASRLGLRVPQVLLADAELRQGIEHIRAALEADERIPEGTIVCFEKDGQLVHRVKVKTQAYLERFSMKLNCSYKQTVDMLWEDAALRDWDVFLAALIERKLSEEEVEVMYRGYFDDFMTWLAEVEGELASVHATLAAWEAEHGSKPADAEGQRAYQKAFAVAQQASGSASFPLLMTLLRKGSLTLEEVARLRQPYSGFAAQVLQSVKT